MRASILAVSLLKGFHPLAPAFFMAVIAAVVLLALVAPFLRNMRAREAAKSDAYRAARASARIEAEIELESRRDSP
ncbi:MAG TPA: hypothetical protein VN909_01705 [Candidatus Dormibacteraeota bacterium]|nr:hypothetical protein [Candidatus Dormibacteraeota bacterium]